MTIGQTGQCIRSRHFLDGFSLLPGFRDITYRDRNSIYGPHCAPLKPAGQMRLTLQHMKLILINTFCQNTPQKLMQVKALLFIKQIQATLANQGMTGPARYLCGALVAILNNKMTQIAVIRIKGLNHIKRFMGAIHRHPECFLNLRLPTPVRRSTDLI